MRRTKSSDAGAPGKSAAFVLTEESVELAYVIKCIEGLQTRGAKVIGSAADLQLAEVIFTAACQEFPRHALVLLKGETVVRTRNPSPR